MPMRAVVTEGGRHSQPAGIPSARISGRRNASHTLSSSKSYVSSACDCVQVSVQMHSHAPVSAYERLHAPTHVHARQACHPPKNAHAVYTTSHTTSWSGQYKQAQQDWRMRDGSAGLTGSSWLTGPFLSTGS